MRNKFSCLFGCVGAIIGAGFVSGREVVSFFSRYGGHSWWLIGLAVVTMILLCRICMRNETDGGTKWSFQQGCLLLVLMILSGSMTAAAGRMVSLILPVKGAYLLGITGTLCLAWLLGKKNVKPLSVLSVALTVLFLGMTLFALRDGTSVTPLKPKTTAFGLVKAALYAVGYGAMNIAVSMEIICRNGRCCETEQNRRSVLLGLVLGGMLFVSNSLYLNNPQVHDAAFPIVPFAAELGRAGYLLCVGMLYLAVLTTLIALVLVIRSGIERLHLPQASVMPITLGIPAALSCIGFTEIVEHLYAPAGLFCLVILFLPMLRKQKSS